MVDGRLGAFGRGHCASLPETDCDVPFKLCSKRNNSFRLASFSLELAITTYIQTVRSRALDGREVEYLSWYLTTHIPELLSVPGFVSAEMHRTIASEGTPAEFLCVYTIETSDLPAVHAAMVAAGASTVPSPAMDLSATRVEVFERVTA